MNRLVLGMVAIVVLLGCKSVPTEEEQRLVLIKTEFLLKKWENLEYLPPDYPIEDAMAGKEGCASVEYIILPSYEIKNIKVVSSSSKSFAKQAKLNVEKWKWSKIPDGILEVPIKTSTEFQFCLESGDGHCSHKGSIKNSQCAADEVIYVTGYKIKHRE